jgi:hypothetical protein
MKTHRIIIPILLLAFLTGCSKKDNGVSSPVKLDLVGTYTVTYSALVGKKSDSVNVTIDGGSYSTTHFGPDPKFCDVDGSISDFGKPRVILVPDRIYPGGCDSLRVPQGAFDAQYPGDTVILERKVPVTVPYPGDSIFTLFLVPAGQ